MLITLFVLVALFFLTRALMLRYGSEGVLSNAVGAAIVCAFLAGFFANFIVFADRKPLVATAPAPAAVAPAPAPATPVPPTLPGTAVSPVNRVLSAAQLDALTPARPAEPYSSVDGLGGSGPATNQFAPGATIYINAWAGDPVKKSTAAGLLVILDGKRRIDGTPGYGGDRMDVATVFKTMGMLRTNVNVTISTQGLTKGAHYLELGAISGDGRHYQIITAPPKAFFIN